MLGFNKPLIAVMVITSTSSFATPTIETMSGDLSAYSTITIEGSNFGNKPNASPSFWNTLDNSKFSTKVKNVLFGLAKAAFLKKEDDEKNYKPLELLDKHNLRDKVMLVNEFVANEDVHKYFQVSDCGLLFYLTATPSGVESLNYNFKLPVIERYVSVRNKTKYLDNN